SNWDWSPSAMLREKAADLLGEGGRLLPGGEVTALGHLGPTDDVHVPLDRRPRRRRDEFGGKLREAGGHRDRRGPEGVLIKRHAVVHPDSALDIAADQIGHHVGDERILGEDALHIAATV